MKIKVVFTIDLSVKDNLSKVKLFTVPWIPENKPAQHKYSDHSTFTILL